MSTNHQPRESAAPPGAANINTKQRPLRLMVRGFHAGAQRFEQRVEAAENEIDTTIATLAAEHAAAMTGSEPTLDIIEIEFLDEPNVDERFFRVGTNPQGMVMPIPVGLVKGRASCGRRRRTRIPRGVQPRGKEAAAERRRMMKAKYCERCHGTGNVDRGNGSMKPCDCVAGLIERARRRSTRAQKLQKGGKA